MRVYPLDNIAIEKKQKEMLGRSNKNRHFKKRERLITNSSTVQCPSCMALQILALIKPVSASIIVDKVKCAKRAPLKTAEEFQFDRGQDMAL